MTTSPSIISESSSSASSFTLDTLESKFDGKCFGCSTEISDPFLQKSIVGFDVCVQLVVAEFIVGWQVCSKCKPIAESSLKKILSDVLPKKFFGSSKDFYEAFSSSCKVKRSNGDIESDWFVIPNSLFYVKNTQKFFVYVEQLDTKAWTGDNGHLHKRRYKCVNLQDFLALNT